MSESTTQFVRSTLVSNTVHGRRQEGRLTGRTSTTRFPAGQLRCEGVWDDETVRWPLARTLVSVGTAAGCTR